MMGDRIISKPSKEYAKNFVAIFGDKPKPKAKRGRSYTVYDRQRKKWVPVEQRPAAERRVSLWPMWSDAFGVHPSQARAEHERSVAMGVPAEFCPVTGRIKFEGPHHRKRVVEALSYGTIGDLDGGYSDPQINEKFHGDRDE